MGDGRRGAISTGGWGTKRRAEDLTQSAQRPAHRVHGEERAALKLTDNAELTSSSRQSPGLCRGWHRAGSLCYGLGGPISRACREGIPSLRGLLPVRLPGRKHQRLQPFFRAFAKGERALPSTADNPIQPPRRWTPERRVLLQVRWLPQ